MQQIDETRSGDGIGSQKLGLGLPLGAKARARAEHGPKNDIGSLGSRSF